MNNVEILKLLNNKQKLQIQLDSMIYGSLEIREKDGNKYIYTHERENTKVVSKYIGEYSEELYNTILNNNIKAKEIKKNIKKIEKTLKELGYTNNDLSENVRKNIDFAKRNLVDTIYKQAILEGVATTYADTEDIIEGAKVRNMNAEDVMKIVNLKHAWEFILNENVIQAPTNYSLLCQINKLVEEGFYYNAGSLRDVPVKIGCTSWQPLPPIESQVIENIESILNSNETDENKAVELLLYTTKAQLFIDGNKRTSVIYTNHYLISKGLGIVVIPENLVEEYKRLLIDYYENNNSKYIKEFLLENCYIKI